MLHPTSSFIGFIIYQKWGSVRVIFESRINEAISKEINEDIKFLY
jgi:hypothetical protein